jgi:hypothetical protein
LAAICAATVGDDDDDDEVAEDGKLPRATGACSCSRGSREKGLSGGPGAGRRHGTFELGGVLSDGGVESLRCSATSTTCRHISAV